MILRQTLEHSVNGYWDGGAKRVFNWEIDKDYTGGEYIRVGSFEANYWFNIARGTTEKLTLSYAKRHLSTSTRIASTFEYIGS